MKNLARKLAWLTLIPAFIVSTAASAYSVTIQGDVTLARLYDSYAVASIVNANNGEVCFVFGPPTAATAGMIAILANAKIAGKQAKMFCDASLLMGARID